MGIINIMPGARRVAMLETEVKRLRSVQESMLIAGDEEQQAKYKGNSYPTYDKAVTEISRKYQGIADWGILQTGNVIDLRAAFIIGQGLKLTAKTEDAENEMAFAQKFIEDNGLDHELAQDLAKEAEIEGKMLIKLFAELTADPGDETKKRTKIMIRWVSYTQTKYKIETDANDYAKIEKATWKEEGKKAETLEPSAFVYKKFGGRLNMPNDAMPRVGKCLTQIDNLDKALRDWREINKLYAAPTPDFECATAAEAKACNEWLEKVNWKVGKGFAHTGKFGYRQPDASGQQAIENEIITLMKMISGTTGVPIHFLGAPELTTKYGAANESLLELIDASTSKEREIWRGGYQELITKAMLMWNAESQLTPLDPTKVGVELVRITQAQWDRVEKIYLPMFLGDALTLPGLLGQVPGFDMEAEQKRRDEEEGKALEKFTKKVPTVDGGGLDAVSQ
jgi:hypothetical protein